MMFVLFFLNSTWVFLADIQAQQEGLITISGKDAWLSDHFDNVHFKQSSNGNSTIALASKEHSSHPDLDLLLHFNNDEQVNDETGNYQIIRPSLYNYKNILFGKATGFFQGRGGLVLKPSQKSFLGPGISAQDFIINFWFYPFFIENGEILFEWEGQLKLGDKTLPQRISAIFQANRVVWQFRNVFLSPDNKYSSHEISSTPYVPESWYHHQLVYDQDNATLELFSDNRSVAVTRTTSDQTAKGASTTLMIHNPNRTNFSIGPKFFGLIDEWSISRNPKPIAWTPSLYHYPSGIAYSRIIDMGRHNAQVYKVGISGQQPGDSRFVLYYALSNERHTFREPNSHSWNRLQGDNWVFEDLDKEDLETEGLVGQFLQFKIELFSDSKIQATPSIESIDIFYRHKQLPAPPSNILVDNDHQGGVHVQWQSSVNNQVLGYKVFAGKHSGQYLEPGYPMDVGDDTSFLFSNLQPRTQYFFVIASYDKFGRIGPFSKEYSIRYIPN